MLQELQKKQSFRNSKDLSNRRLQFDQKNSELEQ